MATIEAIAYPYHRHTKNMNEDGPTFIALGSRRYTATKDYKCDYCTTPIKKGTKYRRQAIIDEDGKFHDSKQHCMCPIHDE